MSAQAQQHAKQVAAENAGLAKEVAGMRQALVQLQAAHVKPTMDSTLRVRPCTRTPPAAG